MGYLVLKKGREKSILHRHPWIFSGAIDKIADISQNGESIEIRSFAGEILANGAYSKISQIAARIWSFDPKQKLNEDLIKQKIQSAKSLRNSFFSETTEKAFRLINAESDGMPGLIVDQYARYLVCQFLSAGAEFWRETIIESLIKEFQPGGIYERSDSDSRIKEGLSKATGLIYGEDPPEKITIEEVGVKFYVDIKKGHKTGFYLDQSENRRKIKNYCIGKDVLNCFSYSGGFGITALMAGANHVINIDSSADSLTLLEKNLQLNNLDPSRSSQTEGDVFKILRTYRDSGKDFDLIILDPPKFAESKSQLERALRGYKDINLLAFKLLRPGGILFTFSCSGHIIPELFRKVISDAAIDSGRNVQQLEYLQQSADHPVVLSFPESLYLKGLICKVW